MDAPIQANLDEIRAGILLLPFSVDRLRFEPGIAIRLFTPLHSRPKPTMSEKGKDGEHHDYANRDQPVLLHRVDYRVPEVIRDEPDRRRPEDPADRVVD